MWPGWLSAWERLSLQLALVLPSGVAGAAPPAGCICNGAFAPLESLLVPPQGALLVPFSPAPAATPDMGPAIPGPVPRQGPPPREREAGWGREWLRLQTWRSRDRGRGSKGALTTAPVSLWLESSLARQAKGRGAAEDSLMPEPALHLPLGLWSLFGHLVHFVPSLPVVSFSLPSPVKGLLGAAGGVEGLYKGRGAAASQGSQGGFFAVAA